MSRSHGTGIPITLKCGMCKLERKINSFGMRTEFAKEGTLVRTGNKRPLRGRALHTGGARLIEEKVQYEYECLDCRHIGWTRHKDILRKPLRAP